MREQIIFGELTIALRFLVQQFAENAFTFIIIPKHRSFIYYKNYSDRL